MEKALLLQAEIRENVGTKEAKKLRLLGKMPATVYGHGKEPVSIALNTHDVTELIHHGHRVVDINIAGKKETVLFKELQYDTFGKVIIHTDLIRVNVTEKVTVEVPIIIKGTAKGAESGGLVSTQLDRLQVECAVNNIPESLELSIRDLDIGESIHAGDIELPSGVKLITDTETLIVSCSEFKEKAEAPVGEEEEQEPQAPEVIGKGKKEEEEQEESK